MNDPQPEGHNGKPHRPTKILSHARRRSGRVAARCERAAAGDADSMRRFWPTDQPSLSRPCSARRGLRAGTFFLTPFADAAKEFNIQPITAQVRNPAEIESAIAKLGREPKSGLIVMPDNFTSVHRKLIILLAAQFRIPTIYPYRYFAEEGGLLSYGVDTTDLFRRASEYVSRILRGAKLADLPVRVPTKFELVINLRTAKALDIVIPKILGAGADQVIE
jgi:ABC transporter substrate binding protein